MSEKSYRCERAATGRTTLPCQECHACRNRKNAKAYMARQRADDNAKVLAKRRAWQAQNPEKYRQTAQVWTDANRHRYKKYNRKQRLRKFGLTPESFDRMFLEQDGRCWLPGCRKKFGTRGDDKPHVDHNHTTGATRKLLCTSCNTRVGFFECNRDRLAEFAEYVDGQP